MARLPRTGTGLAGLRLLLLLQIFQGLSSGRNPLSHAGPITLSSFCRSGDPGRWPIVTQAEKLHVVPRVRRMRTAADWPRGPVAATAAVRLARRLEPSTCTCTPSRLKSAASASYASSVTAAQPEQRLRSGRHPSQSQERCHWERPQRTSLAVWLDRPSWEGSHLTVWPASTSKVSSSRPPPGSLLRRHSTSGVACPGSPVADLDSRSLVPRPQLKVHVKTIGRTHRSDSTVRSRCTHDRQAPASRHATPSLVRLLSPASHTSCSLAV